ncbi:hypothetical protein PHMEG_00010762 [Phytophthora megakarya]|uniref:Transcription activator GCR1-like domain-containing protein n=1 Tax=Phytophthora megakarya TaxID=4795 RepID=A0A225WDF5_9STRA|nr:hypothetical protein PHMEG_00010762 [Phytophthora megakarya]
MSRGVSTVKELWTEWHDGIANQPSIQHLENTYGTKWRQSSKEAKFYSRTLCVINYVHTLVSGGLTTEAALERADMERGRRSIDALSKYIRSVKTK